MEGGVVFIAFVGAGIVAVVSDVATSRRHVHVRCPRSGLLRCCCGHPLYFRSGVRDEVLQGCRLAGLLG